MTRVLACFALLAFATLAGCGPPTKHEILEKAEGAATKDDLESALGAPDNRNKVGPIETWTYKTSDGAVSFLLADDKVQIQATGDKPPEE